MTSTTRPPLVPEDLSLEPSSKIAARHLDRLAVVYVRQSTTQQVLVHGESTRLQYGLVSRAQAYGWGRGPGVGLDGGLGEAGGATRGRDGFGGGGGGGGPGPCGPLAGPGDVAAGPLQRRLAPPARSVCPLWHAHR